MMTNQMKVEEYTIQRRSQRVRVSLNAEIILDTECYSSLVGNISMNGLNIVSFLGRATEKALSRRTFIVTLRLSPVGMVHLRCRKVWVEHAILPQIMTKRMGVEIISPPQTYLEFFQDRLEFLGIPPGSFPVPA